MAKIKKIKVLSMVKFQVVIASLIGLVAGIVYSFGGLIIDVLVSIGWITFPSTPGLSFGTVLAFGALIGMPIIFATIGLAVGLIEALLYNIYAKLFGGIEIDFEE